jgi:hypothetical protein
VARLSHPHILPLHAPSHPPPPRLGRGGRSALLRHAIHRRRISRRAVGARQTAPAG